MRIQQNETLMRAYCVRPAGEYFGMSLTVTLRNRHVGLRILASHVRRHVHVGKVVANRLTIRRGRGWMDSNRSLARGTAGPALFKSLLNGISFISYFDKSDEADAIERPSACSFPHGCTFADCMRRF